MMNGASIAYSSTTRHKATALSTGEWWKSTEAVVFKAGALLSKVVVFNRRNRTLRTSGSC
eukprot:scaffold59147_cov27-Prasinocladus_malaysianus.AAC.1